MLVGDILDLKGDLGVKRVSDAGQQQCQRRGAPVDEPARHEIRAIVELFDGVQHAGAGVHADRAFAAHHVGDRRGGHTGQLRHVVERRRDHYTPFG